MRTTFPTDAQMGPACDAVVELALLALAPEALRWNKVVNMTMAQLAWNAGAPGEEPIDVGVVPEDPALGRLLEDLLHARRTRWPDLACMVFDLDVHVRSGEVVFTFVLSWDGGEHGRPCEMTVDWTVLP